MKERKMLVLSILALVVLFVTMVSATFAWFYFPSSKNLIINTAPALDIDIDLYHLEVSGDSDTYVFTKINKNQNNELAVDTDLVFFHWGGEYICESNKDDYYAIVARYDSNAFSSVGNIKAIFDATIECASTSTYEDPTTHEEKKFRIPVVSLSYAFASSNQLNLTQGVATAEARNTTYTLISLSGEDDQSQPSLILNGSEEKLLHDLQASQYVENFTNEADQSDSRIKVIIFIKVTADEEYVDSVMGDLSTSFGSDLQVRLTNKITIATKFRSVPASGITDN